MSSNICFFLRYLVGPVLLSLFTLFYPGCTSARNAEYDRLIASGDITGAKLLMEQLIDEYSYREENPTLPLRRAQAYNWLARTHGMLGEYDSMKIALLISVSNDASLEQSRTAMLREFSFAEYRSGISSYNDSRYAEAKHSFTSAIVIVGTDSPYEAFAAGLLRYQAYCEALSGDLEAAVIYCKQSSLLGDASAGQLLVDLQNKRTSSIPTQLEMRNQSVFEYIPQ